MTGDDGQVRPLVPADAPALRAAVRASIASLSEWFPWAHPFQHSGIRSLEFT